MWSRLSRRWGLFRKVFGLCTGFSGFAFCLRSSRGRFRASFSDSLIVRVRPVALEAPKQSRTTKN